MQLTLGPISLLALISALSAELVARADIWCGNRLYSDFAVVAASDAACWYVRSGNGVGNYPHQYFNHENFNFPGTDPPYYEFPLLASGEIYRGGYPGPDRVIVAYNARTDFCRRAGQITHRGARHNGFRPCSGTSYMYM